MRAAALTALLGLCAQASGEEGMWPLDNLPLQQIEDSYAVTLDAPLRERLQKASLRLAGGCSASFVSAQGLVLTNQHCVSRCLAQLSGRRDNLLQQGFAAASPADEAICPEVELNQLLEIRDISDEIIAAMAGAEAGQQADARRATEARLSRECSEDNPQLRCDVVKLYDGARFQLYKYRRFQDVRLVFAPEAAIAAFGGDADNFSFPRYALDFALLRAWQDGQPVASADYFPINAAGPAADELLLVTGHPGRTQRHKSVQQLISLRDQILPERIAYLAELRGLLRQYAQSDSKAQRISQRDYFAVENALKAARGRHAALAAPGFMAQLQQAETRLRQRIDDDRALRKATAGAWQALEQADASWRALYREYSMLERMRGYQSDLLSIARHLVRAAQERAKPDGERLREYTEAALPQLTQRLFSAAPIHEELDILSLGWSLAKLREWLGAEHPAVVTSLGPQDPQKLAKQLIQGSALHDLALRRKLWEGGHEAIAASEDPLIRYARRIEPLARAIRERYQREVEEVIEAHASRIARARFALDGERLYPDASFSLRLSYGQLLGWNSGAREVFPQTSFGGLLARQGEAAPFALPASWQQHEAEVDLATPVNFSSSHDIIGGNSGSPVLNIQGELVGLIFDTNLYGLGGAYAYDARYNRAVAVHPAIIRSALKDVYRLDALVDELFPQP